MSTGEAGQVSGRWWARIGGCVLAGCVTLASMLAAAMLHPVGRALAVVSRRLLAGLSDTIAGRAALVSLRVPDAVVMCLVGLLVARLSKRDGALRVMCVCGVYAAFEILFAPIRTLLTRPDVTRSERLAAITIYVALSLMPLVCGALGGWLGIVWRRRNAAMPSREP